MGQIVRKIRRSAINGQFVTEKFANQHPKTTVTETVISQISKKKK